MKHYTLELRTLPKDTGPCYRIAIVSFLKMILLTPLAFIRALHTAWLVEKEVADDNLVFTAGYFVVYGIFNAVRSLVLILIHGLKNTFNGRLCGANFVEFPMK